MDMFKKSDLFKSRSKFVSTLWNVSRNILKL